MEFGNVDTLVFKAPRIARDRWKLGIYDRKQPAFHFGLRGLRFAPRSDFIPEAISFSGNLMRHNSSFEVGTSGLSIRECTWPNTELSALLLDTKASVHGDTSLCIRPVTDGSKLLTELCFRPFFAEKGKVLVVSAYMKGERDDQDVVVRLMGPGWVCVGPDEKKRSWHFTVGKEWKRYSFSVELTGRSHRDTKYNGAYFLVVQPGGDRLWLDAMQIEYGRLTPYAGGQDVDVGLSLNSRRHAYWVGDTPVTCTYSVFNHAENTKWQLQLTAEDFFGRVFYRKVFPLQLAQGKGRTGTATIMNRADRVGWYRIKATVTGGDTVVRENSIYSVLKRIPVDAHSEGRFHGTHPKVISNAGYFFTRKNNPDSRHALLTLGGVFDSMEDYLSYVRDAGFHWIRGHDAMNHHWRHTEHEKGSYRIDGNLQTAVDRVGIRQMFTLGNANSWGKDDYCMGPNWHKTGKTAYGTWFKMNLADPDAYARYVAYVVEQLKGKSKYFQVINEPDSGMDAESYMPYLKKAYTAAKRIDPTVTIIGIGGTSDFGGDKLRFFRECIALGACDYLDVMAIHYSDNFVRPGPEAYKQGPPGYVAIPMIKRMAREKTGRDIPVWITEIGFVREKLSIPGWPHPFGFYLSAQVPRSEVYFDVRTYVRSCLLNYTHGVTRYFQFVFEQGVNNSLAFPRGPGLIYTGGIPTAVLPALNAQIDLFTNTRPLGMFRFGPQDWVFCTEIRKGNGYLYALWCADNVERRFRIRLPADVRVLDVFGNARERQDPIALDGYVVYLLSRHSLKDTLMRAEHVEQTASKARSSDIDFPGGLPRSLLARKKEKVVPFPSSDLTSMMPRQSPVPFYQRRR
jgi:hypothetical protein